MLQRQTISLPLAQGVDTKTDAKQVVAGKLLQLENGIFTTLKAIRKRNGYEQLDNKITNGNVYKPKLIGKALATYNDELLSADGEVLCSYEQTLGEWTNAGGLRSLQVTQAPVQHDTYEQFNPDGVTHASGIKVYAWSAYNAGVPDVYYKVIDGQSGQVIVPATKISTSAIGSLFPRVIVADNKILLYFYDITTKTIRVGMVDPYAPTVAPVFHSATKYGAMFSDSFKVNTTNPNFDVCVSNRRIFLVFNNQSASGETSVWSFTADNFYATPLNTAYIPFPARPVTVFPVINPATPEGGVVVAYGDYVNSTIDIRSFDYDCNYYSDDTIATGVLPDDYPETIAGCGTAAGGFHVYYSNRQPTLEIGSSLNVFTAQAIYDGAFSQVSYSDKWQHSVGLAARPFSKGTSLFDVFVPVLFQAPAQSTLFVLNAQGLPVAKTLTQGAGNFATGYATTSPLASYFGPGLPSVTAVTANEFRFAATDAEALDADGFAPQTGLTEITLDFDDAQHAYGNSTLANAVHFAGGFLQMYDGLTPTEHGFHVYPRVIGSPAVTYSGGHISDGTYQYTACYEWTDANNIVHRSRPADAVDVVIDPTTSVAKVEVELPLLYLTSKLPDFNRSSVRIVLYRTLANGSVFYQASDPQKPTYNILSTTPTVTITDTISDTQLQKRPTLYSQFLAPEIGQSYELENDPAPPAKLVKLHRNRLWVVDSTQPLQLWYSKEVQIAGPVEFNNAQVKQIDPRGGVITAIASLDDKLLIFKDSHIFYMVGQGPTNTGENNDLSDAILLTTDCGCIEPRSIVTTPFGIMFQSRKGIYAISRGMSVEYIGAPVEAYNNDVITSALLSADTNNVRFTLASGKTLVFDYYVQQWGVFTNQNALSAVTWRNKGVLQRSNGRVWVETPEQYNDAGAPIKLKLATSWLSFANVQGFQRVRRMQVLGAWKSAHDLKISVCNDFNDSIVQEVIVAPQTPGVYGEATPYGEELYGGAFQLYQWRIDLARQKTQAVKFIIEDMSAASAGEGLSLTSLAFEVGAKVGLAKVSPGQIYG